MVRRYNNDPDNLELLSSQSEHVKKQHRTSEDWAKLIQDYVDRGFDYKGQSFRRALGVFFTARQQEIMFWKLHGERLSKTEKEYYSRVIKKRLRALANPLLFRAAEFLFLNS